MLHPDLHRLPLGDRTENQDNDCGGSVVPIPEVTPNLARRMLQDHVYSTVREWIVTGVLRPGETLKDTELAERLGVSRTPVRETLQRLKNEGYVQTEAHRRTLVAPIDAATVGEIYEVVRALESVAILVAGPRLQPDDLDAMTEANRQAAVALETGCAIEASRADAKFHDSFIQKCGNGQIIRLVDEFRTKLRRAEVAYFERALVVTQSVAEHEHVIAALRRGDYESAAAAIRMNWDESLRRLRRLSQPR